MTSLAPALLLSMPQLTDSNFSRAVVLLCKHSDEGAFGLVVNRPLVTSGTVTVHLDPPVTTDREVEIRIGGPVEPQRSWMLVGHNAAAPDAPDPLVAEGAVTIADGIQLSTSSTLLRRLLEPNPPRRTRLVVGYAGWGPGQLEAELAQSAWLLSDVDASLVFDTPAEQMWERAIRRLGADPAALQMSRGVH